MLNIKDKITLRENVIGYIYGYELFAKQPIETIDAWESGNYTEREIKVIEKIAKNYEMFKKIITSFTKTSWKWARISPLNRAILIYGAFELYFNDKALVIDVLVRYAKNFIPDDSYKFINSILDKIGRYYEKTQKHKKDTKRK